VKDPGKWAMSGFNFRFNDILASIGIEQLKRLPTRVNHLRDLYITYEQGLKNPFFKIIPVDIDAGEVPVYSEFLVENREQWITQLSVSGIELRPFYPNINTASYLKQTKEVFLNSEPYGKNGTYLPNGPDQPLENIEKVIDSIQKISI